MSAHKPVLVIFLTVFIDLLGFGIVIPLLPVYSKLYDASELTLGLLFASFSGMQFLFAPMWGRVSDKVGRRPVLLGGLVGTALAYGLFAFADSLLLLFASRIAAGFFGATISTAQAYIADVTGPDDRAKGMGMIGAAFGLGFTIGPLVGGELTRWSVHAPGAFAAVLSLLAAGYGYLALPEPKQRKGGRRFGMAQIAEAMSNRSFRRLLVLSFLGISAFACFEAMFTRFGLACFPEVFGLTSRVEQASLDQVMAAAPISGRYLAFIGLMSALIQGGLIRRLVPRFGETKLIVAGPLILGAAMFLVALAPALPLSANGQWWVVILGCLLMPAGFGINNPSLSSLMSKASPATEQGAYLGIGQSIASLARMTAPPIAGLLFGLCGPSTPFYVAAALLGLATLLAAGYRR